MKMNIIAVYNKKEDKILMCLRKKEPYKGLYNLVGGKVEENETDLESAYRELQEESGITKEDIVLTHLMTCNYQMSNNELQVYIGKLKKEVKVVEEVNKLYWIDASENFFDMSKYAGEGIIGHIIEQVKLYKDKLLKEIDE